MGEDVLLFVIGQTIRKGYGPNHGPSVWLICTNLKPYRCSVITLYKNAPATQVIRSFILLEVMGSVNMNL
jgi:hypothetical protein